MGSTGRHRRPLTGGLPRFGDLVTGRHNLAAVCGLAVVSLLGSASHSSWLADAPDQAWATGSTAAQQTMGEATPRPFLLPAELRGAGSPGALLATAAGGDDVPGPALAAYQRAAAVMAEAAPACGLSWTLLAAVGRVESDHGRHGGAVLGSDAVSRPHIVGVALDGTGRVAEVRDTDDGALDGDDVWDRAVGAMQLLPATWALAGVDGDGNGSRDPHDLDDAALAAGVYLCAGGGHLAGPQDVRRALLRYNPSTSYAALVMTYERHYRSGRFRADSGPALTTLVPDVAGTSALSRATLVTPR